MSYALIFTLSAMGISETAYLIKKRLAGERPICPLGGECWEVLESKYGKLFFIPADVLGLLFYFSCSLFAAFLVIGIEPLFLWHSFLRTAVAIGSLFSAYLVYVQLKIIRKSCFWCLMSAITVWLLGIITIFGNITP